MEECHRKRDYVKLVLPMCWFSSPVSLKVDADASWTSMNGLQYGHRKVVEKILPKLHPCRRKTEDTSDVPDMSWHMSLKMAFLPNQQPDSRPYYLIRNLVQGRNRVSACVELNTSHISHAAYPYSDGRFLVTSENV